MNICTAFVTHRKNQSQAYFTVLVHALRRSFRFQYNTNMYIVVYARCLAVYLSLLLCLSDFFIFIINVLVLSCVAALSEKEPCAPCIWCGAVVLLLLYFRTVITAAVRFDTVACMRSMIHEPAVGTKYMRVCFV